MMENLASFAAILWTRIVSSLIADLPQNHHQQEPPNYPSSLAYFFIGKKEQQFF